MVEEIFAQLPGLYRADSIKTRTSYYFSLDDVKKTIVLTPEDCTVTDGRLEADCVCKTSSQLFLKIWNEGYRPGMKDFLSGAIKSNNPGALRSFLLSFGKDA
jgi:putative sterol carrier protein